MNSELRITIPDKDQAADILHIRKTVFCEELTTAGANPESIEQHTKDWGSEHSVEQYRRTLEKGFDNPDTHTRAIVLGQTVVGIFSGYYGNPWSKHPNNEIKVIQLDRSIRGRGVGRALMAEFESMAYPGLPIELDVLEGNLPALGFYKRLGFTVAGSTTFQIANEAVPVLNMRKQTFGLTY